MPEDASSGADVTGESLPALPSRARTLLHQLGLRARKGLGQHFLVNRGVLATIVRAAELGPEDTVVEVGPGLGILTEELAKSAGQVVAVELDRELAAYLEKRFSPLPNVRVVNADILEVTPEALLAQSGEAPPDGYKVVANLPYYIASPVLRHFLEASPQPRLMVVMLQKEVAKAMTAAPGDMTLVGVSVQIYGKPAIVARVSPNSFYPPPKVSSAIVRIETFGRPKIPPEDTASFFQIARAGFSAPRKQLHNSLAQGLGRSPAEVAPVLERAGISPQRRAESLSIEEWIAVWKAFGLPL